MWAMFWWASATDCLIREEVDEAFFRQVVEASCAGPIPYGGLQHSVMCWKGITADLP